MATLAEAARHLFLDEAEFLELVENGVIERNADGSFDLPSARTTGLATLAEVASHVCLDEAEFLELVENGVIERNADGSFDLEVVRESYLRHLRIIAGEVGGIKLPWRQ
ncbi:MAG: hypothetical protein ABSA90_04260 [Xanthobacteraceae bacterium]|jgi:hypothetical protein